MPLKLKKIFIALVLLMAAFAKAEANGLSYIYIQGDKKTPFYVKLEGEMQPRYGKNYCIISKLAPGPVHIEILFQQNEFPAEKFTILVPQNGFRGFMLTKKEGVFALYDLHQAFYLQPGNTEDEDIAPTVKQPVPSLEPVDAPEPVAVSKPKPERNDIKPKPQRQPSVTTLVKTEPEVTSVTKDEPRFLNNIELDNERSFTNDSLVQTETAPATTNSVTVTNSDCPKQMVRSEYESLLKKSRNKSDGNRLKYLLEQIPDNCFSTIQARALARTLTKDPERYAFLKEVYPRISDQSNFPMLEAALISKEWKEYFRLILQ